MITSIKINKDFEFKDRIKKLPLTIKGKNINVIAAPNGYGKSTIFQSIKDTLFKTPVNGIKLNFTQSFIDNPSEMYFMSPYEVNGKALLNSANPFDSEQYNYSIIEGYKRIHLSSGQETKEMLLDFKVLAKKDNRIIFLDEPEISMDAVELYKFKETLKNINNIQIWIISHNPLFVLEDEFNVISLDEDYLVEFKHIYSNL